MRRLNFGDFQRKFVAQKFKFKIKIDRGAFTYYEVLWGMGKRGKGKRMKREEGKRRKGEEGDQGFEDFILQFNT